MSRIAPLLSVLLSSLCFPQEALRNQPAATQSDLAELKALILRDLKDPKAVKLANGFPDRWRLIRSLQLCCGWTDLDFVPPLISILDSVPEYRLQAASCLVMYQQPELNRRVAAHSKHLQDVSGTVCVVEHVSVQQLMDEFQRTRTPFPRLGAAHLDAQLATLQTGKPPARLKAWLRLASYGWFAPWQEYGLDIAALWKAAREESYFALTEPILGAERGQQFLAQVRTIAKLPPVEVDLATAYRWRLGCDAEGPACRRILEAALAKENFNPKPEEATTMGLICFRPTAANLDLYRKMIRSPGSVHQQGWLAIVNLDRDESFEILDSRWKEPGDVDQTYTFDILNSLWRLGARGTSHRSRWVDWLMDVRLKLTKNMFNIPAWIQTVRSMAGRDFGPSGQMFPGGFDAEAAQKTTDAILEWYAKEKSR